MDVDFEFYSPVELDFHGLKCLLRQTFPDPRSTKISNSISAHSDPINSPLTTSLFEGKQHLNEVGRLDLKESNLPFLSTLSDQIIFQTKDWGSVVKTDGNESDPFAIATIFDLSQPVS